MKDKMQKRLHEIDGIRGWAALVVLVFHLSWEVFGVIFPVYRSYYFKLFLDGPLAVYVFFVLSGDALSNSFVIKANDAKLVRLVLKRYFRLVGPILLSCTLTYLILKQGFSFNIAAAPIVERTDWLGSFLPFEASFTSMVSYAFLQIFTENTIQNSYNPFLWPMSIELYGSFFIFGMLFSFRALKNPIHLVILMSIYFWILGSFYALFFVGLGFSLLRANGFFERIKKSRFSKLAFLGLLLIFLVDAFFEKINYKSSQASILMAGAIVFLIYSNKEMVSFFSNRISRFLGKVSFAVYVCQFCVIISFTSWLITYFSGLGILDFGHSLIIIIISILMVFIVAMVFSEIENIYLKKIDSLANILLVDADRNQEVDSNSSSSTGQFKK